MMKIKRLTFEPVTILHNTIDDEVLRRGRRTVWGDLTPTQAGLEKVEQDQAPYTYAVFIQSKDGKVIDTLAGRVGRMGGEPVDRFSQLEVRAAVDAFLLGGGTLRADRTIGVPFEGELLDRRKKEKGDIAPLNVFFSDSGNFPTDAPVFREPDVAVALFVTERGAERLDELKRLTPDVTVVSSASPLRDTWAELWRRGIVTIGFEGGPTLLGLALKERLVHELLITHSPLVLGGTGLGLTGVGEPIERTRTEPVFLALHKPSGLLFERSRLIYM